MSITLSVPPAVVQEVREWAEGADTSLNQYIRDCLERKVAEVRAVRKSNADRFMELCEKHSVSVPKGWKFNRAALYEVLDDDRSTEKRVHESSYSRNLLKKILYQIY